MNRRNRNDYNVPRSNGGQPSKRNQNHARSGNRRISPEEQAQREAYARRRYAQEQRRRQAQIEYERRIREQEKAIRKQEFREDLRIIGGRILVFLIVLVCLTLLSFAVFLISFSRTPDSPSDSGKITYFYGGKEMRSSPIKASTNGKILYFCFNDLSDYLGMSESGTADEMKFILPKNGKTPVNASGDGTEESIVFLSDEAKVIINGQLIELDTKNILREAEIWVSTKIVTDYMTDISLVYDEKKQEMRISRIKDEENSTDEVTLYLAPSFILKDASPIDSIVEDPLVGDVSFSTDPDAGENSVVIRFNTELSDYEAYMNPTGDMRDAFLTLVNKDNPLDESYKPTELTELSQTSIISEKQYLVKYASKALDALFKELKSNEFYSMAVYKGYSGENLSDEHSLGLSVDMDTLGCVSTDFQYQPEYEWLVENSWKFGFILRYPKNKTSETGHEFEPWHYRYVGRYHAQKIRESGLSLEEYLKLG